MFKQGESFWDRYLSASFASVARVGLLIFSLAAGLAAQNSNTNSNASPRPDATPTPTPIPLAVVISESDAALTKIREIDSSVQRQSVPAEISEGITSTRSKIDELRATTTASLADSPTLEAINGAERDWKAISDRLDGWISTLQNRATAVGEQIDELKSLGELWRSSMAAFRDPAGKDGTTQDGAVPDDVIRRTESVLAAVNEAERVATGKRAEFLSVESRLSELKSEIEAMLASLKEKREQQLVNIFAQSEQPVWSADPGELAPGFFSAAAGRSLAKQWKDLQDYAARFPGRFIVHAILLLLLVPLLYWAKKKVRPLVEDEPKLRRPAAFFELPVASALIVSALFSGLIYSQPPKLLSTLIATAAIIPGFLVIRRIIESPLHYLLYGLLGLFLLDRVRDVLIDAPLMSRLIFALEMLAAGVFLIWFYFSKRVANSVEAGAYSAFQRVRRLVPVGAVVFLGSFVASALGFVSLGYLVGNGLLRTGYAAIFLYTAVHIVSAGIAFLLRAKPFSSASSVRNNRSLIIRRITQILNWCAAILWLIVVLNVFAARDAVFAATRELVGYQFSIGEIAFTVGDILLFIVMVWAAFMISRLVRFFLEEDVYPRLGVGGGASFAISTVFHYLLLIAAFFVAISAVGFELSRFAIVAGAIGVGLGFGLQNIINNFVSGLILLFEQPVKVGDTIQIGEHMGSLKSIGLRASVLRKVDGSDVIVPNSHFISDEVINWTMLDERRRIDIPVGVKYGTNAEDVKKVLLSVPGGYDRILTEPAPTALFVGMGESSIDFELRAWTDDTDGWVALRSELVTDVYNSLNEAGIEIPFPTREVFLNNDGGGEGDPK